MNWRVLLLLLINLAMLAPTLAALSPAEEKLVGRWQYDDTAAGTVARQDFRANGAYTAELRKEGKLIRKFEGLWRLDGDMIVYTYTADSLALIPVGTTEQDHLVRMTENSYTIEAGDHLHRTYFRVK
jgi:hypothetical protein